MDEDDRIEIGLFDMFDNGIAGKLGISTEEYVRRIESIESDYRRAVIIESLLDTDEKITEKTKKLFNKCC